MSYIKIDLGDNAHAILRSDGSVDLWQGESDVMTLGVSLTYEQTIYTSSIQDEFTEKAMREERGMTYAPKNFPFNRLNVGVHE